jgi:hypothetical protein
MEQDHKPVREHQQ